MMTAYSLAGTIYVWTDEKGVKRFSDQPPPAHITDFEVHEGSKSSTAEEPREGLQQMYKEIDEKNAKDREKEEKEKAAREIEEKAKAEAEAEVAKNTDIDAERARLENEIVELRKRALGPTFTEGMRQNQIFQIQKQIEALDRQRK